MLQLRSPQLEFLNGLSYFGSLIMPIAAWLEVESSPNDPETDPSVLKSQTLQMEGVTWYTTYQELGMLVYTMIMLERPARGYGAFDVSACVLDICFCSSA